MFLGINYSGTHDSSIVLVNRQGEIIFGASEERYSRIKKDGRFPRLALEQIDISKVESIGIPYLKYATDIEPFPDRFFEPELLLKSPAFSYDPYPPRWLASYEDLGKPLYFFDHHLSHAAAGHYLSGLHDALIITSDYGATHCPWNMGIYTVRSNKISPLHLASNHFYHPLCSIYSDITVVLGYQPSLHEGKITGLAAYGSDNSECESAVWEIYQDITIENRTNAPLYMWVNYMSNQDPPSFEVNYGLAQHYRNRLKEFFDKDIARAVQNIVSRRITGIISKAIREYPAKAIILSGGLFANVKINLDVKNMGFEQVFVCPPMGDEGVALGAAILLYHQETHSSNHPRVKHHYSLYLGNMDLVNEITEIKQLGINYTVLEDESATVASLLAQGKTVARVSGRMEFGPRALGNRSVLFQATDPNTTIWLNDKLHRTEFMPFAPILRADRAQEFFDLSELKGAEHTAEYMTICFHCNPIVKQLCPAVVHVDNTARPQLVRKENNPALYGIIMKYEELTGLPMLINTSFNVHDEPIVSSIVDAVVGFFQCELDYLVLGSLLIERQANPIWCMMVKAMNHNRLYAEKSWKKQISLILGSYIIDLTQSKTKPV